MNKRRCRLDPGGSTVLVLSHPPAKGISGAGIPMKMYPTPPFPAPSQRLPVIECAPRSSISNSFGRQPKDNKWKRITALTVIN